MASASRRHTSTHTRRLRSSLLVAVAWFGLGSVPPSADGRPWAPVVPAPPHPAESRLLSDVRAESLLASVRALVALGPRLGGTPSGDRASDWLARRFRDAGLRVEVIDDPPLLAYWHDRWELRIAGGPALASAFPFGYSPTRRDAAAVPLVSALDLRASIARAWEGKAVYTRTPAGEAIDLLARAGVMPAVVITSAPHRAGAYTDWASIGGLAPSPAHAVPVFAVSLRDGEALERAARQGASVSATLETTIARRSPRTVVASIPGRGANRYWLVSAHGDSDAGGPGADDNASGVAVVVELAARLSSLVRTGAIEAPASTIRFAVWGSEYHSARAFIRREGAALANCDGVINLDQVGTGAEREAIYFESNDVPWNARLLRTFEQVGRDYAGRPGFWPEFSTTPSQGGTDAYAFLPRSHLGEGITTTRVPVTTVYTAAWDTPHRLRQTPGWAANGPGGSHVLVDYSRYYHSTGDTPEHTTEAEPQNMVRAAQAVGVALLRLVYDSGGSAR